LSYLRGRYYDSSTRRFTTSDPAEDGLNWFSYCGNNPLEYLDPSGYAYFRTQEKWGEDYVVTEYYSGDDLIKLLNTTSANSFLVGTVVGSITGWLSKLAPKTVIAAFTAVAWLRTLNAANISDMAKEAHAEKKGLRFQTTITQDSAVDVTERIYISAKDVEDYASGARKP
jgi:hypothetical protein